MCHKYRIKFWGTQYNVDPNKTNRYFWYANKGDYGNIKYKLLACIHIDFEIHNLNLNYKKMIWIKA